MKFYFLGLFLGAALSFYPFFLSGTAVSLSPEWNGTLDSPESTMLSINTSLDPGKSIPIKEDSRLTFFSETGKMTKKVDFNTDELFYSSGKGDFYVKYSKTGKDVELYNINNDKFWKITSNRYPKMSYNGNLVFLTVSDLSSILIVDKNAGQAATPEITGRFQTSDFFPENTDASAFGFLDGTYFFLGNKGEVLLTDRTAPGSSVKSIALSSNLKYGAVHYGDTVKDSVLFIDIEKNKKESFPLKEYHVSKTALFVSDEGTVYIISGSYIYMSDKGDEPLLSEITPQYLGHSKICQKDKWTAFSYKGEKNPKLIVTYDNVTVLDKSFPEEEFMDCFMTNHVVIARGMKNLYCWSFR